jgi:hypothetical protein
MLGAGQKSGPVGVGQVNARGAGQKKSPGVETPRLWYLDLISVVDWTVKI